MSEAKRPETWTWEAYLDWEARQPVRYELIDGDVHAMGGGTAEHDTIGNNIRAELRTQLRGKPCRPQGPDLKVRAGHNGRYPDALVDCGPRVPGTLVAQEPKAVFEVLSKGTGWIDQTYKLRDYDGVPSIQHYVLVSQDEPLAVIYRRSAIGRLDMRAEILKGINAVIEMPDLGIRLPLTEVYDGIDFQTG